MRHVVTPGASPIRAGKGVRMTTPTAAAQPTTNELSTVLRQMFAQMHF
jgi:hypothetical protein